MSTPSAVSRPGRRPTASPPVIDVAARGLHELADDAWAAIHLANHPPTLFSHETGVVWVEHKADGLPVIQTLDHDRLRYRLARAADWVRVTRRGTTPTFPPSPLVYDLLACPEPPLPTLRRLTYGPYMTARGVPHVAPGYNPESRLYYEPSASFRVNAIPENPTVADIKEAVTILDEPLADFPFVSETDRAHALALQLVPFATELIEGAIPAHGVSKPTRGSGGGLLVDVALWPALGGPGPKLTTPSDESEWRRTIFAKLLQGSPIISIDNIDRPLASPALASAITEDVVEDRLIRQSATARVSARRIWTLCGNNLALSDEMSRRTIPIRIDAGVERPELRTNFRHSDLRRWVQGRRGRLVWAALVILRAWYVAGRPLGRQTMGSFEAWARTLGGILDHIERPGFLGHLAEGTPLCDPTETAWSVLVRHWWERFRDTEVGVSELWSILEEFRDLLIGLKLDGQTTLAMRTAFGLQLSRRRDRICEGHRITYSRNLRRANQWRLAKI